MQVNPNFNPQNQQVWRIRHQSIAEMVNDVQAGNMSGAQQALTQVQQADQVLGITEGGSPSSTSSGTATSPTAVRSRVDLSSLMAAVQSGDLSSAQTAWQNIQASSALSGYQGPAQGEDHDRSGMAKDLNSLLSAVSSGDASGLQTAATAVSNDLQSLLGTQPGASQTANPHATLANDNDPTKTVMDDLATLLGAAQKGDTTTAQAAEQKMVQDLQRTNPTGAPGVTQQVGGHHHHHHHQKAAAETASTDSTTPVADILSAT